MENLSLFVLTTKMPSRYSEHDMRINYRWEYIILIPSIVSGRPHNPLSVPIIDYGIRFDCICIRVYEKRSVSVTFTQGLIN